MVHNIGVFKNLWHAYAVSKKTCQPSPLPSFLLPLALSPPPRPPFRPVARVSSPSSAQCSLLGAHCFVSTLSQCLECSVLSAQCFVCALHSCTLHSCALHRLVCTASVCALACTRVHCTGVRCTAVACTRACCIVRAAFT